MSSTGFEPQMGRPGASVDALVDERGSRIAVDPETLVQPTGDTERAVGATSPTNWWRMGLLGLLAVVAILFVLQLLNGAPGTDMQPGTPSSESVVNAPANP